MGRTNELPEKATHVREVVEIRIRKKTSPAAFTSKIVHDKTIDAVEAKDVLRSLKVPHHVTRALLTNAQMKNINKANITYSSEEYNKCFGTVIEEDTKIVVESLIKCQDVKMKCEDVEDCHMTAKYFLAMLDSREGMSEKLILDSKKPSKLKTDVFYECTPNIKNPRIKSAENETSCCVIL